MTVPATKRTTPPKPKVEPEDEVFDASGLLDEIKSEGRWFSLGGEKFWLPAPSSWADDVYEASEEGPVAASRAIMGAGEYDRFLAAGGTALFLQRLTEKLFGTGLGESSASSGS